MTIVVAPNDVIRQFQDGETRIALFEHAAPDDDGDVGSGLIRDALNSLGEAPSASRIPSFSHDAEGLRESWVLA
jgi:hypothetical protein